MTLKELKQGRVFPFTKDPEFLGWTEDTFNVIRDTLVEHKQHYSTDWVATGLCGLSQNCIRKAMRLFDLMVNEMPGKDKTEDEFLDMLMEAFYAYVYFKVLSRRLESSSE